MEMQISLATDGIHRMSRKEFDKLGSGEKKAYLNKFPHSSYADGNMATKNSAVASKLADKLGAAPRAVAAFKKARQQMKNDISEAKTDKEAAQAALGATVIAMGGAIAGAIKYAKIGAVVGQIAASSSFLAGAKIGAGAGAAIGAAPGVLIGVALAGLYVAHKAGKTAKLTKKNMAKASSNDAETMANDIADALERVKKHGLEPWQRDILEQHYGNLTK